MWRTIRHQGRIINTLHSALSDVTGSPLPNRDGHVESMEAQMEQHGQQISKMQGVLVDLSQDKHHKLRSDVDTNAESLYEMKESFAYFAAKEASHNEALCAVQNQLEDQNRVIQEFTMDFDRFMSSHEPDRHLKKFEDIENTMSRHEGAIKQAILEGCQSSEKALETLLKLKEVQREVEKHEQIISDKYLEESTQAHVQGDISRKIEDLGCTVETLKSAILESQSGKEVSPFSNSNLSLEKTHNNQEGCIPDVSQYGPQINSNTFEIQMLHEAVSSLQKLVGGTSNETKPDEIQSGDFVPDEESTSSKEDGNMIDSKMHLSAQSDIQLKVQDLEKKVHQIAMSLENKQWQEEHDDLDDLRQNVTTKLNCHDESIESIKKQMDNMWKHFSDRCSAMSQNASIQDTRMETGLQRTTDLKAILRESVQEFAKRIEKLEEYVGELRSEVMVKADAMNQSEIEELKWTVESQRTDIEALNRKIVSLEQKLNNTLAEMNQRFIAMMQ